MAEGYTASPDNIEKIEPYVLTDTNDIVREIFNRDKCYFYDACSFRRHSNMEDKEAVFIWKYMRSQNSIIVITRCILMELASQGGILHQRYIDYIKKVCAFGIPVLLLYEEDLFFVMDICFHTNTAINSYLCWPVRLLKGPVSTITKTLEEEPGIYDEVIKGRNLDRGTVYKYFFEAVRKRKESGDNLGEELLAICLHMLAHLPGEPHGKFCLLTDDRGAAGKTDALFRKTAGQYGGKKIMIISTPKLAQVLYQEHILTEQERIRALLGAGTSGNIVVLGNQMYDLRSREISLSCEELAKLIAQPNGIYIVF